MLDVTYNSTKIIDSLEVTPPVTVTYNGSTIATLNAGDTKTLQCNGKVMASDVVIGDKTLQCNGKIMASDVVVEVGGVTPTLFSFTINGAYNNPYQAEEGMTWGEWCDSSYNTNGFFMTYRVDTPSGYEWRVRNNSSPTYDVTGDIGGGRTSRVLAEQTIVPEGGYSWGGIK